MSNEDEVRYCEECVRAADIRLHTARANLCWYQERVRVHEEALASAWRRLAEAQSIKEGGATCEG